LLTRVRAVAGAGLAAASCSSLSIPATIWAVLPNIIAETL
jgi:hypothetical protein